MLQNLPVIRTVCRRSLDDEVDSSHVLNKTVNEVSQNTGKLRAAMTTELTKGRDRKIHVTKIGCPTCEARSYPYPFFESGNTTCPVCLYIAPVQVEVRSGRALVPGVGTDIAVLAERYNTDAEPLRHEEYAVMLKSLDEKDVARQMRGDRTRMQSLFNAIKAFSEAAKSYRHRISFVVQGNKRRRKVVERKPLDVDHLISMGANPCCATPLRLQRTPGLIAFEWHWDPPRTCMKTTEERDAAGRPRYEDCVAPLNNFEK